MNQREKSKVLEEYAKTHTSTFHDPRFGRLEGEDLSGLFSGEDEPFAKMVDDHGSREQLIAEMAATDPEMQEVLQQAGVTDNTRPHAFHTGNSETGYDGTFFYEPENSRFVFHLQARADGASRLIFVESTTGDSDAAKVAAARTLKGIPGGVHELTEQELLRVSRAAAASAPDGIALYLQLAFPHVTSSADANAILNSPVYTQQLADAIFFVHRASQTAIPDSQYEDFIQAALVYLGERQPTISLLASALDAYQRRRTAAPADEQAPNFDNLSDEELEATLDSATRLYAQATRHLR